MNKLPNNFTFKRYGLETRLVTEDDASFILGLRTNASLTKHIHPTDHNLEKQIQWIREYKIREQDAREYYFLFTKNSRPIGVSRISNIYEYFGLGGSWLCSPDNETEVSMATPFVANDICFEIIGLDYIVMDVRKANTHVWKFHQLCGAKKIGETDIDYYFYLYKDNYYLNREKYIKLLNLKD